MNNIITKEVILMLLPLFALQLSLAIYCIIKMQKEGVEQLNKTIWTFIVIFVNMIGPVLFLLIGRKKDDYN